MTMTKAEQERQMVKGNEERQERTLGVRIEEIQEQEREQIREQLQEKFAEMSRLLAVSRDNAQKLSESFIRLKEAVNQ